MRVLARSIRLTLSALMLLGSASSPSRGIIGYPNPFTPEQCELAIRHAERLRNQTPDDSVFQRMRAEGLLCLGLADDPEALDLAIDGFSQVIRREPLSFFPWLYYAEAVRQRYPLSDEAVNAFVSARQVLVQADVGSVRTDLFTYIDESIEQIRRAKDHFSGLILTGETVTADTASGPSQIGDRLMLIARTGPAGLRHALAMLDSYVATHPNTILSTFYRAELSRGIAGSQAIAALYSAASSFLCGNECELDCATLCTISGTRLRYLETRTSLLILP